MSEQRFTVYPQPPDRPLPVGAGQRPQIGFDQHAGAPLPGQDYAQMMYLRVTVIGGLNQRKISLAAGQGDPVVLDTSTQLLYRDRPPRPASYVGDVWMTPAVTDKVVSVFVGFDKITSEDWRLIIDNAAATECKITWVVADGPDATAQPWIDVAPAASEVPDRPGTAHTTTFEVTNYGTTAFTLNALDPNLPEPFKLETALPATVDPVASMQLAISLIVPAASVAASARLDIKPADVNSTAQPGHNGSLAVRAIPKWPQPTFGPSGSQFTPGIGPPGTPVTLSGTGFDIPNLVVRFDTVTTDPLTVTAKQIQVKVPDRVLAAGMSSRQVKISVSTAGGPVKSTDTFTVVAPPQFAAAPGSQFTPTTGPSGTPVTLAGSGFDVAKLIVQFGTVPTTPSLVTATKIQVKVPAGVLAGSQTSRPVAIKVSTAGGSATSKNMFTVVTNRIYINSARQDQAFAGWSEVGGGGTTNAAPAVAAFGDRLYVVAKGIGDNGIYFNSARQDQAFVGWTRLYARTTNAAPAVAAFGDRLYVLVKGIGDNGIYFNSARQDQAFVGWTRLHTRTSNAAPAVAAFGDRLYVVAKGIDDNKIYITSARQDKPFASWTEVEGGGTTNAAPAVAAFGDRLYVVAKGIDDNRIYINSARQDKPFAGFTRVQGDRTTNVAPAVTAFGDRLYLVAKDGID